MAGVVAKATAVVTLVSSIGGMVWFGATTFMTVAKHDEDMARYEEKIDAITEHGKLRLFEHDIAILNFEIKDLKETPEELRTEEQRDEIAAKTRKLIFLEQLYNQMKAQ